VSELSFGGGRPPDENEAAQQRPPEDEPVVLQPELEGAPEPAWEMETLERCLGAIFLVMHWTLGRGGPPDAFLPEPRERREMAVPLRGVLNRWMITRALSRFADAFAALTSIGGFVQVELRRTADYKAGGGDPYREPRVDEDLFAAQLITTRPAGEPPTTSRTEPAPEGPVRTWRPPSFIDPALD
jgi:hypothetical protein